MDDELAERCRSLVAVASVDHEETAQMFELSHGEVCGERGLLAFLWGTQRAVRVRCKTSEPCSRSEGLLLLHSDRYTDTGYKHLEYPFLNKRFFYILMIVLSIT